jgi:hypothetical protein
MQFPNDLCSAILFKIVFIVYEIAIPNAPLIMLAFLQWVDKVNVNLNVLYFRLFINVFIYFF